MNGSGLQRRVSLPVVGCVLCAGSYMAIAKPPASDDLVAHAFDSIWAARPDAAIQPLIQWLRQDPGSPERWSDLSEAMFAAGREADTRYCLTEALQRGPFLPHVAMRAADMYFRLGDIDNALQVTHGIVEKTPAYDAQVFNAWHRLGGSPADVFSVGIGSNARAGREYFSFLVSQTDLAATDATWTLLQQAGMAGRAETLAYSRALRAAHDYDRAARIEASLFPEIVSNGGFETEFTPATDWQVDRIKGVTVSRDTALPWQGTSSLRIAFDGANTGEYGGVRQTRTLAAGTWTLRAMIRMELQGTGIAEGPAATPGVGLQVLSADTGQFLARTGTLNGSHGWMPISTVLTIGPHARLVQITVARPPVPQLGLTMAGNVWFDDVTLVRSAARNTGEVGN